MKKIIIFSTAYLPMIGGAELAVHEIAARLGDFSARGGPASGWELDLICARLRRDLEPAMRLLPSAVKKQEKIGRINVYRVGFGSKIDKLLLPFFGFLKARKIYKDCQRCHLERSRVKRDEVKDLVSGDEILPPHQVRGQNDKNEIKVVIWGIMASWGSAAAWLFKIFYPRVPFLLTLQEGDAEKYIQEGRLGLINIGWRLILKKADFVQVISNYLAEMARKYGYRGEIDVVPNGVDLKMYNVSCIKHDSEKIKSRLGISSNDKIIITVSRLVEKNGIGDLISAVGLLDTLYPPAGDHPQGGKTQNTKLLVLGSGPLRRRLEDSVGGLGLQDKVFFLGDISNEEVPKYLAIADIFVRPSLSEGLGTAFLEAMATGVPIIGTPVGGIPDFLKNSETGLFCEVKNPASIAKKIKLLLEDDDLRSKIIRNARQLIEERYSWDKIAPQMAEIFDKIA